MMRNLKWRRKLLMLKREVKFKWKKVVQWSTKLLKMMQIAEEMRKVMVLGKDQNIERKITVLNMDKISNKSIVRELDHLKIIIKQ